MDAPSDPIGFGGVQVPYTPLKLDIGRRLRYQVNPPAVPCTSATVKSPHPNGPLSGPLHQPKKSESFHPRQTSHQLSILLSSTFSPDNPQRLYHLFHLETAIPFYLFVISPIQSITSIARYASSCFQPHHELKLCVPSQRPVCPSIAMILSH